MSNKHPNNEPSDGDFVPAVFARSTEEAQLYCDLLSGHHIPAVVGNLPGKTLGTKRLSRGVPVLVPDSKLDQASEIIAGQEVLAAFEDTKMSKEELEFEDEQTEEEELVFDDEDDDEDEEDEEEFDIDLEDDEDDEDDDDDVDEDDDEEDEALEDEDE